MFDLFKTFDPAQIQIGNDNKQIVEVVISAVTLTVVIVITQKTKRK